MFTPDYLLQNPAWFHTRILVGPGQFLTRRFAERHNITAVINCAFPEDSPDWFRQTYSAQYICLQAHDNITTNLITQHYDRFEQSMREFLRNTTGTVYVHCQAGINRSAFLALAYICRNCGQSFELSIRSLRQQRPCMFQNPAFKRQVEEFVNGYISRPQSAGVSLLVNNSWNSRLLASGAGSISPRVFGATRNPEKRT
jgi:protein-tyrosine phosphatase